MVPLGPPQLVDPVLRLPLWAAVAPGFHVTDIWDRPRPPRPTLSRRTAVPLSVHLPPSLPPTEQRCLREHLELVVLHPPHHHRLLFYAEPRAGRAVGVSLCYSPATLLVLFFQRAGKAGKALFSLSRRGAGFFPRPGLARQSLASHVQCVGRALPGEPSKGAHGGRDPARLDLPPCVPGIALPLPRERGLPSSADLSFRRFPKLSDPQPTTQENSIELSFLQFPFKKTDRLGFSFPCFPNTKL